MAANSFFTVKMTHLPLHHHGNYRISPIVFILSEHVTKYENMPYGRSLAEIRNSKWLFQHENSALDSPNMDGFFLNLAHMYRLWHNIV